MRTFLAKVNTNLPEESWTIPCVPFATDAPEQHPIEDVWLKGKHFLRKNFLHNKTLASVQECFVQFLSSLSFKSSTFDWYYPQII